MAEEIRPALSREEWEAKQAVRDGMGISVDAEDDSILCADGLGQEASVMSSGRHALAALALHGQGYGFTREDVAVIAALVGAVTASNPSAGDTQAIEQAKSLAAKIAALLPEEEANG